MLVGTICPEASARRIIEAAYVAFRLALPFSLPPASLARGGLKGKEVLGVFVFFVIVPIVGVVLAVVFFVFEVAMCGTSEGTRTHESSTVFRHLSLVSPSVQAVVHRLDEPAVRLLWVVRRQIIIVIQVSLEALALFNSFVEQSLEIALTGFFSEGFHKKVPAVHEVLKVSIPSTLQLL
jgi:hypothetical protein